MSRRIMSDGKPYVRTTCRDVRPYHAARRPDSYAASYPDQYLCVDCGAWTYWSDTRTGGRVLKHNPGTFWESS